MRPVDLNIYKYPRRFRYTIPAQLAWDKPEELAIYLPAGVEIYSPSKQAGFPAQHHILNIFWPGRYFNAEISWYPDWTFRGYYLNLALPHEWDETVCAYIDLELDVTRFEDEPIQILDEDEYEEARLTYNFPPDLVSQIETTRDEVVRLLENEVFPFDGSLKTWRPQRG